MLERDAVADLRSPRTPPGAVAGGRAISTAGALADELEPGTPAGVERPTAEQLRRAAPARRARRASVAGRRRRIVPWVAALLAVLVGGGAAATLWMQRAAGYRSTVAIAGVALTRGTTAGKLVVETDGAIEPDELARLYTRTLDALRVFVKSGPVGGDPGLEIHDPIDVLLAVPAAALCEPTAYLDRQVPRNCAATQWAIAIGAHGTHRLMVVSDRAQLDAALRRGVAQAACEFSPVADDKVREFCDITGRFAGSAN
jgi:hypothetical protein